MRPTGAGASGPPRRRQVLDAVPPASGAVVMGSGILCVDFYSVGQPVEAAILLWFAAGTWLFLAAGLALRLLCEPARFAREARSPAALTGVAGTGVLGTAFAVHGYYPVAAVMLGLAGVGWALLLTPVLSHWETPVAGVSFLLTVATEGLAVLGATLAARNGAAWLLIAASAALILGLALYIVTVTRFALGQLLTSWRWADDLDAGQPEPIADWLTVIDPAVRAGLRLAGELVPPATSHVAIVTVAV